MSAHAEHSRRRLPLGVASLPGATFLHDRLNDAIGLLSALPDIVVSLRSIEGHIQSVDAEVTRMREGVNRLESEVHELRGEIGELSSGINEVSASVGRLEPHVSDLSRLARPLKRRRRSDPDPARLSTPGNAEALGRPSPPGTHDPS